MLQGSAQILLRTYTAGDISAISSGSDFKKVKYGEILNLEESLYYRNRYNGESKEKSLYNIFSLYKRNAFVGLCPYGMDIDMMKEYFEKSRGNNFRYWNKIRMGFKLLLEVNLIDSAESALDYLDGEIYFSYLHIPHGARGDQTTKARKGSFMMYILATPSLRGLGYMKFNVGSVWIKLYYRQEKKRLRELEYYSGINAEVEVNRNGYNRSIVESSRDVYRGLTLFAGPEYNIKLNRIIMNIGISITTENH